MTNTWKEVFVNATYHSVSPERPPSSKYFSDFEGGGLLISGLFPSRNISISQKQGGVFLRGGLSGETLWCLHRSSYCLRTEGSGKRPFLLSLKKGLLLTQWTLRIVWRFPCSSCNRREVCQIFCFRDFCLLHLGWIRYLHLGRQPLLPSSVRLTLKTSRITKAHCL